jgi:hypothetical protein
MLANPDFRRFWLSSVLTNFGAQVTMLALPICAVLLILRLLAPAVLRLHRAACAVRHACVAAGALALAVATVFGTRLRAVKD